MIELALLLAAVGLAVGGVLAYASLLRRTPADSEERTRSDLNIAIADENREMFAKTSEREVAEEADVEVDVALLADIHEEEITPSHQANRWAVVAVAILIPLIAFALYWSVWGRPGTVLLEDAALIFEQGIDASNAEDIESNLKRYVAIHPDNAKAWVSLMSFQWLRDNREDFRATHRAARRHGHTSRYGDSLYLLDAFGQRRLNLTTRDKRVRDRLRELEPQSQVVAMYDAVEHTALGDFAAANQSWETVLSQADLFQLHATAELGQRATRARLASGTRPKIVVDVSLEQPFPRKKWLFVYARAAMDQPPLAVIKRPTNGARRFEVVLDDTVLMQQGSSLRAHDRVFVTARLSATPDALAQADDISVTKDGVNPNESPRIGLAFGSVRRLITAQIATEESISPIESVYIIVKSLAVSAPPVAVRRIYGMPPTEGVVVTLADTMLPHADVENLSQLVVSARLSRSSSAMARPGDIESREHKTNRGGTVQLTLNQTVGALPSN